MPTKPFPSIVHTTLAATPISSLLASTGAVILERIAMGGGATRWYYCSDRTQLEALEAHLRPGSVVSFYFDNRIQSAQYSPELKPKLETIIIDTGDVVLGCLGKDQLHLDIDFVTGPKDLDEVLLSLDSTVRVFYGAFPARDNDGIRAVRVTIPDNDGVVRPHPH
jgi:hypothetical protein